MLIYISSESFPLLSTLSSPCALTAFCKESFTDDELKTLTADIEAIRKIEEQIAEIEKKNTGSDNTDQKNSSNDASPFKNFSGQDYDGNSVDESLFSKNAVTVINFWFTGCKPCVAELSKLNELNDAIKSMGGEVVGINTETFDGNKTAIKEAKTILENQGAKYRNLSIDSSSDAGKYASDGMIPALNVNIYFTQKTESILSTETTMIAISSHLWNNLILIVHHIAADIHVYLCWRELVLISRLSKRLWDTLVL